VNCIEKEERKEKEKERDNLTFQGSGVFRLL
jgi:hypothetical protein